jgi:hypothetical protein
MPTAIKLPKIKEREFPQNQIPWRSGCSEVLYHREVIKVNPGDRLASVHPRKKRATIKPVKFVVAAWQARIIAHKMLYSFCQIWQTDLCKRTTHKTVERYLPNGNLTINKDAGYLRTISSDEKWLPGRRLYEKNR